MKRLAFAFLITCFLAGCGGSTPNYKGTTIGAGGSGGSSASSASSSSSVTTVLSLGNGTGNNFAPAQIALSTLSLSAGGSATLSVTLVDQNGIPYTQSTIITFSSSCLTLKSALLTDGDNNAINSIATTTGSAIVTYVAQGCSGSDVITASTVANNQTLSATGAITVQPAALGQVVFISASPNTIGLKGTGIQETSTLVFKVLDSSNGAVNGATVTFSLITSVGGISLSNTSAVSGADGKVQTVVKSGTVHTTVRVSASATFNGVTQSAQSSALTIFSGIPTTSAFSLAPTCPNVEGFNYDGINNVVTVRLADRYNNPVPDNTAVSFITEGGKIDGQCTTTTTSTESGVCSVNWTSQNPRPSDGRVTILATTLGEDSFADDNANGFYDTGELYADLGEPYEDDNEDGMHNPGEIRFLDFNQNGSYDATYGSFKGITCTGITASSTCSLATTEIGAQAQIIMSTSGANLVPVGPQQPALSNNDDVVTLQFNLKDQNGNAMPNGTTIDITANTPAGVLDQPTSFVVPCDKSTDGLSFYVSLTRPSAPTSLVGGKITIAITTPHNIVTLYPIALK